MQRLVRKPPRTPNARPEAERAAAEQQRLVAGSQAQGLEEAEARRREDAAEAREKLRKKPG